MNRGTHGEKIVDAMESDKLPAADKNRLKEAVLNKYNEEFPEENSGAKDIMLTLLEKTKEGSLNT